MAVTHAFYKHCDERIRLMREFVHDMQQTGIAHAWDGQVFVSQALAIIQLGNDCAESYDCAAASDSIEDYFAAGHALRSVIGEVLETCHDAQQLIVSAIGDGIDVPNSSELDAAITRTEGVLERIRSQWPDYESDLVEQSRRDFAAGRSRTTKEIVDERRARAGLGVGENRVMGSSGRS